MKAQCGHNRFRGRRYVSRGAVFSRIVTSLICDKHKEMAGTS
jgi:hypothetical protein